MVNIQNNFIDFTKLHGKLYSKLANNIRKHVKSFVKVRNRIFRSLKTLANFRQKLKGFESSAFTKEDQMNIFQVFGGLENESILDPFTIWQLKKRNLDDDYISEPELTE